MMANVGAVPPCRFCWEITEPFLRRGCPLAHFYTGSPTPRMWRVTLLGLTIFTQRWHFGFVLSCEERNEIFLARILKVCISLDGKEIASKDSPNYSFCDENRHSYQFQVSNTVWPREQAHRLIVEVEIASHEVATTLQSASGLFYNPEDFAELSESMKWLFESHVFSDIQMQSTNSTDIINAHLCILAARWGGFITINHIYGTPNAAVQTRMSLSVLKYILQYIYSGALNENLLDLGDLASRAELFQEIDRFKIYHLYKVFVGRESTQGRQTINNLTRHLKNFSLGIDVARGVNNPSYPWPVVENGPHQLLFSIRFFMTERIPSFRYCFQTTSESFWSVRVNLELVVMIEIPGSSVPRCKSWDLHQRVRLIKQGSRRDSGPCHFEGIDLPMDDLKRGQFTIDGREYRFFIRCTLSLSTDEEIVIIETESSDQWQTNKERLEVLSDHLYLLQRNQTRADMRVLSSEGEEHLVHKAILAARVPGWREVLNIRVNNEDPLPVADADISGPAFRFVLEYMYTGKIFRIPIGYLEEIGQFAVRGGFSSLQRLVSRLR